jgi:hypothetical protein
MAVVPDHLYIATERNNTVFKEEQRSFCSWHRIPGLMSVCGVLPACSHPGSEDFDPTKFENTAALGLLQRFVNNGREADGSPTRDRLKMIPRYV